MPPSPSRSSCGGIFATSAAACSAPTSTGERGYEDQAVGVFRLLHRAAGGHPEALAHLLYAMDFHFASVKEVALVGPPSGDGLGELASVVRSGFRPHVVLAGGPEGV